MVVGLASAAAAGSASAVIAGEASVLAAAALLLRALLLVGFLVLLDSAGMDLSTPVDASADSAVVAGKASVLAAAALLLRPLLPAGSELVLNRAGMDFRTAADASAGSAVVEDASVLAAATLSLRPLLLANCVLVPDCSATDSVGAPTGSPWLLRVASDFLSGRCLAVEGAADAGPAASVFASHFLLRPLSLAGFLPEGVFDIGDGSVSEALANTSAAALLLGILPDLGFVAAGTVGSSVDPASGTCWPLRVL